MGRPDAPRRKVIAFVLSGVFPGLGQLYNRQWVKGAAFAVAGVILSWLAERAVPADLVAWMTQPSIGTGLATSAVLLLAVWIWSAVDAWRVAGR